MGTSIFSDISDNYQIIKKTTCSAAATTHLHHHPLISSSCSMSQHPHHGVFSFSNGSSTTADHQIRRDVEEEDEEDRSSAVYETAGMLSEMFNFPLTAAELLPTPSANPVQGFALDSSEFTWVSSNNPSQGMEGQGLSLSLSSKVEEMRMGSDIGSNVLYFNHGGGGGASSLSAHHYYHPYNKDLGVSLNQNIEVGYGSSLGAVNVMRSSKYVKPAQQLLQEFCSVGRGHFNNNKFSRNNNPNTTTVGGGGSKDDVPPLSSADRIEHQRRKVKLLSMLDEVDRRYNHYCEQMQMVVKSFDLVMGSGAAVPYTALAQKAMSRHFRCLKEAVAAQVKRSCEALGEKEGSSSGVTKGETPRLKALEQRLRQQRAFHQMGMMDQEAWRPQRGLPERSVNILRAWLFEHFLHPYPSDADKHLLSRQTGLSRNQVSNWFINARVRLWKPMVEDMYQQEAKEDEDDDEPKMKQARDHRNQVLTVTPQTPTPNTYSTATATATVETTTGKRSEINAPDTDPSLVAINRQRFSDNQALSTTDAVAPPFPAIHDTCRRGTSTVALSPAGTTSAGLGSSSTPLRFGTTAAGDVSLTLGLRHAGNMPPPDNSPFSVTDLGGY